jgi:oxalate decarboxylase/phosphoglucose isomerase-like protein (cupin superfamily)
MRAKTTCCSVEHHTLAWEQSQPMTYLGIWPTENLRECILDQTTTSVTSSIPKEAGHIVRLERRADARGTLIPIEFSSLPFAPRRIFAVTDVPAGTTRGQHAHRRASQVLICLSGHVRVELRRGGKRTIVDLENASTGLLILPGTWASQTYVLPQTTLLVLANEPYDPDDYLNEPE